MNNLHPKPESEKIPANKTKSEEKVIDIQLIELEKKYEAVDREGVEQRKKRLVPLLEEIAAYLKNIYPNDLRYEAVKDFYEKVWREFKQITQDNREEYSQAMEEGRQAEAISSKLLEQIHQDTRQQIQEIKQDLIEAEEAAIKRERQ